MNCTPYSHIDAASFKASTAPKVFTDKNNSYYLSVVASGTLQVATLSTTSPVAVTADRQDYQGAEVKESGYFIHKDSQGGFSIELPNNFYVKETPLNREDLIFSARSNKGSQTYPVAIAISVEKNAVSESDILRVPSSALEEGGFKVARDYSVAKGNKTIRLIESGILSGNGLNRVTALYVGSSKLYLVTSIVESTGWEENKDMMTRMVLSFKLD